MTGSSAETRPPGEVRQVVDPSGFEALALETRDVWFVGRLTTYRYYNMDQVVGQALSTFRRIDAEVPRSSSSARRVAAIAS
jgi:UDP-galactopyranose mutase